MSKSLVQQLRDFFESVCHDWDNRYGFIVCTKCGIIKNDKNFADKCEKSIKIEPRKD